MVRSHTVMMLLDVCSVVAKVYGWMAELMVIFRTR
jgi:hypothetical protein